MTEAVFYVFAAIAVVTAAMCVLSRSAMSAVLWLTATMLSLAALYVVTVAALPLNTLLGCSVLGESRSPAARS